MPDSLPYVPDPDRLSAGAGEHPADSMVGPSTHPGDSSSARRNSATARLASAPRSSPGRTMLHWAHADDNRGLGSRCGCCGNTADTCRRPSGRGRSFPELAYRARRPAKVRAGDEPAKTGSVRATAGCRFANRSNARQASIVVQARFRARRRRGTPPASRSNSCSSAFSWSARSAF